MNRFTVAIAGLLLASCLCARPAFADLRVCNQTSYILYAAVGYEAGVQMLTRGWTRVLPGGCATALQGSLNQPNYFVYARSSRAHLGSARAWGGRIRLCAKETNFAIDVPVGAARCASDDAYLVPFASITTGHKASWTTTLADAATLATPAAAKAAGVARLLGDLGYRVDPGAAGSVAQALADFRTRLRLPAKASDTDVFDALETEALNAAAPAGYTVCNDGTAEIWAAIGFALRRGNIARGWWDVPPGACARVLTAPLDVTAVYLHATKVGNANLVGGPVKFCTGSGSFQLSIAAAACKGDGHAVLGFAQTNTGGANGYVVHIGNSGLLPPPPRRKPEIGSQKS